MQSQILIFDHDKFSNFTKSVKITFLQSSDYFSNNLTIFIKMNQIDSSHISWINCPFMPWKIDDRGAMSIGDVQKTSWATKKHLLNFFVIDVFL